MTDEPDWILLPGFSQTASVWHEIAAGLPGARPTDLPLAPDVPAAAAELAATRRGRWAGYSMGGRVALQAALDHPERVDRLVLISSTAGIRDQRTRARRRHDDESTAQQIEAAGLEPFFEAWVRRPLFGGVDPTDLRRHRMTSPGDVAAQLRSLGQGSQEPVWDRLGELDIPVTFVAGGADAVYVAIAKEMYQSVSGARIEVLDGAGHALLQERPREILRVLGASH